MSESTVLGSAVSSTVKNSKLQVSLNVRCVVLYTMLLFTSLPAIALAQSSCPGIHVKILNIRNSTGVVACALFESSVGFPAEFLHSATNIMIIKVRDTQARCDFEDIAPGTYAFVAIHDENMNGKLDTNLLGSPTEGYGFSNEAKSSSGSPSFSDASLQYNGQHLDMTISLHY
ncbi:MAG: DUF2141 domain-containing protein [Deltaproteobacteria bacterium]|nr:DUF2141 domain-containing protein [Deltaproteobacteria bacterium]